MSSPKALHSSATNEHFTPAPIVEMARAVMDGIDLDPATTEWNPVGADTFFTAHTNGFDKPWGGSVFLNPPGGKCDKDGVSVTRDRAAGRWQCNDQCVHGVHDGVQSSQRAWWEKLVAEWRAGRVEQAIFVCFSVEMLQTTQSGTWIGEFPLCFPKKRVAYDSWVDGKRVGSSAPPHASVIVYVPPMEDADYNLFYRAFGPLGKVLEP